MRFGAHAMRAMYSTVKTIVNTHSAVSSSGPCCARMRATLSRTTARTLRKIAISKTTSNAFPARVSASKMTSYQRSRQLMRL